MADPKSRNIIGEGIRDNRSHWFIQGHIGSTWKDEQYFRTRDMKYVRPAFEDLLKRLQTDYIDLGMIHYALTRPAVGSILCGYDTSGRVYLLWALQTLCCESRYCYDQQVL